MESVARDRGGIGEWQSHALTFAREEEEGLPRSFGFARDDVLQGAVVLAEQVEEMAAHAAEMLLREGAEPGQSSGLSNLLVAPDVEVVRGAASLARHGPRAAGKPGEALALGGREEAGGGHDQRVRLRIDPARWRRMAAVICRAA